MRSYSEEFSSRNVRSLKRYGLTYAQQRRLGSMSDGMHRLELAERSQEARLTRIFA
jgi:hypothetical protein